MCLCQARSATKALLKEAPDPARRAVLDSQQKALKVDARHRKALRLPCSIIVFGGLLNMSGQVCVGSAAGPCGRSSTALECA